MKGKEWRFYTSEMDASWVILADSDTAESEQDIYSLNNLEAVMRIHRQAGDYVSVSLLSASFELDPATGKLGLERDFYIKLECLKDGWFTISRKHYKKEEALEILKLFVGLKKDSALKIWRLKKLGADHSGNRIELD